MAVLNYKCGPWGSDSASERPFPRRRGENRRNFRRSWRRKAKRRDEMNWRREVIREGMV